MATGHSRDAAHTVNTIPFVAIDLADGQLIPLGKLHLKLKRQKSLIAKWRREGLEDLAFRMESRSLWLWSEDVREWIKQKYKKGQ